MYYACKAIKSEKEQFEIIGIQVAGNMLHLNVLIKDKTNIHRYYNIQSAEIPVRVSDTNIITNFIETLLLLPEKSRFIAKETGLMARIMELEQSAKENSENAKLRDAELNARIVELERLTKENEEFKNGVTKLEQRQTKPLLMKKMNFSFYHFDLMRRNLESPATYLPQDVIDDDDSAETLDFVETVYKEQVGNEIIQRIREKKLRDQELLSTPENNTSNICHEQSLIQEKCQEISVTNPDDRQKEKCQEISVTNPDDQQKEKCQESEPTNHNVYVTEKSPLKDKILAWYYYSDNFENKVIEICHELGVTDKTARTRLYKEILSHLPSITSGNLRMKTLRAKKIHMLFRKDGVGIDKIKKVSYKKPLLEIDTNRDDQTNEEVSTTSIPSIHSSGPDNLPKIKMYLSTSSAILSMAQYSFSYDSNSNDVYRCKTSSSLCPSCKENHIENIVDEYKGEFYQMHV
ncbi:hypothetical protein Glove_578g47 [Diversispora epigaea]|uniref:Uncharacterized protein n=1 Tax=Diversispora epigaea TaxID=1348612 RepID=A0A397GCG6_9GLOM|nr:hypothetical protein Glove_578g47 [Diversispora epigaea]